MALNELLRKDPRHRFNVVNILGVVCEQLALFLQETNESMSRREAICRRQNVLCNRVKDTWIFTKQLNIEDVLRVSEAKMFKF